MLTRTCNVCGKPKSISGVWYLVRASDLAEPSFRCETCYARPSARVALAAAPS